MPVIPDLGILPCRAGITHLIYRKRSLHISLLLVGLLLAGPRLSAFAPGRVKPKPAAGDARAMRARTEVEVPSETAAVGGANLSSVKEARETVLQQRRDAEVFAMIRFCRERLGYDIAFLGPRVGYRAMTLTNSRRIEIYMRPGDSARLQAYDLAHELGHAFDLEHNNAERRRRWRELRGIPLSTPWFACNRCPDYGTPAGDFAETFAFLLLGPGNYRSTMALPPTREQVQELAAFCQTERMGENRGEVITGTGDEAAR
ncbi:MAG: hypothetical protein DMG10_16905 [Acidobacteria bacterium]|nr:MAG: hypothetical protein DMG10_16905 [Acidobacteriota bacterium]PYV42130.1 MAG: hypothetical protein DMG09_03105 [Acidobacteriota bacterium]